MAEKTRIERAKDFLFSDLERAGFEKRENEELKDNSNNRDADGYSGIESLMNSIGKGPRKGTGKGTEK